MPPTWVEPTIPVSERPQTHTVDQATTGVAIIRVNIFYIYIYIVSSDIEFISDFLKTDQPIQNFRCCTLNIYSTNIRTEYFKYAA
jgi:hypothetical protein